MPCPTSPSGPAATSAATSTAAPSVAILALLTLLTGGAAAPLGATDLDCAIPGDRRLLRVEIPGREHLCEVSVTYQDGERRVLWYADNDTLFCSEKIAELESKYTGDWGFNCSAWPDDDGIEALALPQRLALDRELRARTSDPAARPTALRVATTESPDAPDTLVAVQWLGTRENTVDRLSVYREAGGAADASDADVAWTEIASIDNLTASLPAPADGATIERALLTGIDAEGTLALTTVVTPAEGPDPLRVCRGRQRLALDGLDGLAVRTPHRHACEPLMAEADAEGEPPPADGG